MAHHHHNSCVLLLPVLLLLVAASPSFRLPPASAAPFKVTDSFEPACGLMTEPPANGWQRWSDWRTWGRRRFRFLGLPGRGLRKGRDVTIPCGVAVLLDMPNIEVGTLNVKGWLKVLDSPSLPRVSVRAKFIIVKGKLTAGTPSRHFSQRLTLTLLANSRRNRAPFGAPQINRAPFKLTSPFPADKGNPRDLGHKAFAVVGGQLSLHGMPGGSSTPSWVRLAKTANRGQRHIVVDADVAAWRKGWSVGIASTSTDLNDAEHHEIASVQSVTGGYRINLKTPLKNRHDGGAVSDGVGGTVDIRAEVALLDRHITITGADEAKPNHLDGGHFMVYMTKTPQHLEGVQFKGLGNQGVLGKYPVHFHVCGSGEGHTVRKNAIVFTRQRCMVIHATSNMTIEDNVTYETKGHCFLLEEGAEMQNVFRRNLGINVRKVSKVIPSATTNRLDFHTDKQPSTFWLATPFSSFYHNVAAGSEDSGFWLEANPYMRGLSKLLPYVGNRIPFYFNWGTYDGNVAHSSKFGFRTYPHGSKSRYPKNDGSITKLSNLLVYRNRIGIFFFNSERLHVEDGVFVDNAIGIDLSRNAAVTAKGCKFIVHSGSRTACTASARATNSPAATVSSSTSSPSSLPLGPTTASELPSLRESLGPFNPYADDDGDDGGDGEEAFGGGGPFGGGENMVGGGDRDWNRTEGTSGEARGGAGVASSAGAGAGAAAAAAAAASASARSVTPSSAAVNTASSSFYSFESPMGIAMSQSNPQDRMTPNSVEDTSFSGYGRCSSSSFALVLVTNRAGGYWNSAMFVKGLTFASGTKKFWAMPNPPSVTPPRGGLVARYYALRDLDGSLLGKVATAVAPYAPILPPPSVLSSSCSFLASSSIYACEAVCYRAVGLAYYEWGVGDRKGLPENVLRPYSYLSITRVEDNQQFIEYGTDNDNPYNKPASSAVVRRYLTASLLAGYTYRLAIRPADTNREFYPETVRLVAYDAGGCSGSLKLILEPRNTNSQWVTSAPNIPCVSPVPSLTYKQYVCEGSKSRIHLSVSASSHGTLATLNLTAPATQTCSSSSACSSSTSSLPRASLTPDPLASAPLPLSAPAGAAITGNEDPYDDPSFYADGAAAAGGEAAVAAAAAAAVSLTVTPAPDPPVGVSLHSAGLLPASEASLAMASEPVQENEAMEASQGSSSDSSSDSPRRAVGTSTEGGGGGAQPLHFVSSGKREINRARVFQEP